MSNTEQKNGLYPEKTRPEINVLGDMIMIYAPGYDRAAVQLAACRCREYIRLFDAAIEAAQTCGAEDDAARQCRARIRQLDAFTFDTPPSDAVPCGAGDADPSAVAGAGHDVA